MAHPGTGGVLLNGHDRAPEHPVRTAFGCSYKRTGVDIAVGQSATMAFTMYVMRLHITPPLPSPQWETM